MENFGEECMEPEEELGQAGSCRRCVQSGHTGRCLGTCFGVPAVAGLLCALGCPCCRRRKKPAGEIAEKVAEKV